MVRSYSTILKGKEVHDKLIEGSKKTAEAVSTTFGPYGKNVALTMLYNLPHVTKDGVTVIRAINLIDQTEDVACQAIKEAAKKTADVAGDGTTSTTLLASYLIEECFNYLNDNPTASNNLKVDLQAFEKELIAELDKITNHVDIINNDLYKIAMVASNGDHNISTLVTDIFKEIGKNGIVTVHDSLSYDTFVKTTKGIKLDRSHISPMLESGNSKDTYMSPAVLCTDLDITTLSEAMHIISLQEHIKTPLLVICNDLVGSALSVIAHAKLKHKLPIEVIRAPHIADARREAVLDLSIVTGGVAFLKDKGWNIESITPEALGSADSFEINFKETNIIGRHGKPEDVEYRVKYYNDKIKEDTDGLKENYKKRLSYFNSGASVLYVGGTNNIESQEKKDRIDDTIKAVKAALEEGYVPGGTLSYHMLLEKLQVSYVSDIYNKAIKKLTSKFFSNGDIEYNDAYFKAHTQKVLNECIIDPSLVIKSTIKNAIGAAVMVFTTDCVIIKHDPV